MHLPAAYPRSFLSFIGFKVFLCGLLLGTLTVLAAESQPTATFSILNNETMPLRWTSDLVIRVDGLDVHDKNLGSWRVKLNGIPFKVAQCFINPLPAGPELRTEVRLVLDGLDDTTEKSSQQIATTTAAAIRIVAPKRWSKNQVSILISCGNILLIPAPNQKEPAAIAKFSFELISWPRRLICWGALGAIAWAFYWAGSKTGAFRDPDALNPDFRQRTFSLARSQLAFWSVIVVASFLYVYLVTGISSGVLNDTALWLLGISSTTSALSQVAGNGNSNPAAPPPIAQRSVSFLADILSDSQGMNVHRLQMAIWTMVFGCIFVSWVVTDLAFPEFDHNTYVLMGISSGTYIWFKRNES